MKEEGWFPFFWVIRNGETLLRPRLSSPGVVRFAEGLCRRPSGFGAEQFGGKPFSLNGLGCIVPRRRAMLLWGTPRGAGSVKAAVGRSGSTLLPRGAVEGASTVAAAAPWQMHPIRHFRWRCVELFWCLALAGFEKEEG